MIPALENHQPGDAKAIALYWARCFRRALFVDDALERSFVDAVAIWSKAVRRQECSDVADLVESLPDTLTPAEVADRIRDKGERPHLFDVGR